MIFFTNFKLNDMVMMQTVRGIYQDGTVVLEELLPTSYAKVLVTVLDEADEKKDRKPGSMKGEIWTSDDFNDPLSELEAQ